MKKQIINQRTLILNVLVLLLLLSIGSAGVIAQGSTIEFANISEGETISSLKTLVGTIEFPDFMKYEIFLKSGKQMQWVGNAHKQIRNGNLVRLDPRVFPSGTYELVVRQVHNDSNYTDATGPTINIENPNGFPTPYYPEIEPSLLYASESKAILRARNCAAEDFFFDYASPGYSGDAGDIVMSGKMGDTICIFQDIPLRPAEYAGTGKGGAQSTGAPIEFLAEAGKIYELTYLGGGTRIEVHQRGADSSVPAEPIVTPEPTKAPQQAAPQPTVPQTENQQSASEVDSTTHESPPSGTQPVLPISGKSLEQKTAFGLGALGLIVALAVGGFLAVYRKK